MTRPTASVLDGALAPRSARDRPVNIPRRVSDTRKVGASTVATETPVTLRRGGDGQPRRRRRSRSRLGSVVLDVVMIATFLVLAWALWPSNIGGWTSYVIVHGHSMDPTFTTGDLAVMRHESNYHVGQIVAYEIPKPSPIAGHLVIHRIVGTKSRGRFVMKGDNRTTEDAWFPTRGDILGRLSVHVEVPGGERFWVLLPWGFCLLIGFAVMWILWPRASDLPEPVADARVTSPADPAAPRASRRERRRARAARLELACLVTGGVAVVGALVILILPAT